jgi:hypothetical protein
MVVVSVKESIMKSPVAWVFFNIAIAHGAGKLPAALMHPTFLCLLMISIG